MREYDLIVVGSGIAGLFAAITAMDHGRSVVVITKGGLADSNTRHAQGGIATAIGDDDSPLRHALDTCRVGAELNDSEAVSILTHEAKACTDRLVDLGVGFDFDGDRVATTWEAGHTAARVMHARGDATGLAIQEALSAEVRRRGMMIMEHTVVERLLGDNQRVGGVQLSCPESPAEPHGFLYGSRILVATGGAGWLYSRTTNAQVATGDGLAMAYRAGAQLMDLEFFQFHPTALAIAGVPAFLISEATRGEGGLLRTLEGERFMPEYHKDAELAPRDVVSRAIWAEMNRAHSDHVTLDLSAMAPAYVRARFPNIHATCLNYGLDISVGQIPVAPAAHYFMGGIRTDSHGRTSLSGLLAAGEVAASGVHGANRLASNSLLEGLVFGQRSALAEDGPATFLAQRKDESRADLPGAMYSNSRGQPRSLDELRAANWSSLGIIRSGDGLLRHADSLRRPENCGEESDANRRVNRRETGLRDQLLISALMTQAAVIRPESRGAHFRNDYPEMDPEWRQHIVLSKDGIHITPASTVALEPQPV